MVRANRRITLEEIENGLNEDCSHFSVHKIVSETLGYRKVSARWVDKWLKEAAGEWYNTGITNKARIHTLPKTSPDTFATVVRTQKMEQGREEDPKEPMESDPDSESGENTTFPKKETTLGRTQEIAPSQQDVTPPPPVSDVLGRLTTTLHQLSAVTGHRERWNRYDGSYEAQSFFTNYDAQADRAQLQYSTRLRKPANLLQAPLRVINTRAYVTCSPDHL
ncbi:hypothetical protein LAZ67_2001563 [Cordylochernes scorpioides]|uniref:Uncharacterized protein n=1 Tax=Cordylochernes scorpioides TaxID=51811 RepID=A0ABY6K1K8_9ARAC|nr:hypothetical protein LAZ67_2001563 [Cordylochernes scorpioides]